MIDIASLEASDDRSATRAGGDETWDRLAVLLNRLADEPSSMAPGADFAATQGSGVDVPGTAQCLDDGYRPHCQDRPAPVRANLSRLLGELHRHFAAAEIAGYELQPRLLLPAGALN